MKKATSSLPFMSVVVISYNGHATIHQTIDSLLAQTYPKKRYEIIVVNDASTDDTADIVRSYKRIRLVNLEKNHNISGARNAGLAVAKGDIYVSFDDDCIAKPDWLAQLAAGYAEDNPLGVGGRLVESESATSLTGRYITACDSHVGGQTQAAISKRGGLLGRLFRYVTAQSQRISGRPISHKTAVGELYGANGSYPMNVLRTVKGWRDDMTGIEDRDLSLRIRQAFPDRTFYLVPDATIVHDRGQTFWQYLKRPYKRGPVNLAFYRRNHMAPPIFPAPFLFGLMILATALLQPLALPLTCLAVPSLLYFWWPAKALRDKTSALFLFPYMQLAEETMVVVGLLRGYVQIVRTATAWPIRLLWSLGHLVLALGIVAAWMWLVLAGPAGLPRTLISCLFLLTLPGYCALQLILGKDAVASRHQLAYTVALSLLLMMGGGLILNEIYTVFSLANPFTLWPLTIMVGSITAGLATLAFGCTPLNYRFVAVNRPVDTPHFRRPPLALLAYGLLLPVLAVGGAITLNNGGRPWLAALVTTSIAATITAMVILPKQLGRSYSWLLYSIGASILLGTAMRGWNITGHDVMQEYQVFRLTMLHNAWHMQYYQDAYTACLSITILPTILQRLTGIQDIYIYKLLFQCLAALITPTIYRSLATHVSRRAALLGALIFLTFPTFLTDMMMLNRQEIALLFFVLAVATGLQSTVSRQRKSLLTLLLLTGMILSHYSTSYAAIGALCFACVFAAAWSILPRWLTREQRLSFSHLLHMFSLPMVVSAAIILIAWGSIATQTSNNIYQTLRSVTAAATGNLQYTPPAKLDASGAVQRFVANLTKQRALPSTEYYPAATTTRYPIHDLTEQTVPARAWVPRFGIPAGLPGRIYDLFRTVYTLALEGLVVLGLAMVILLRKRLKRLPLQYAFIGGGMLALIVMQVLLPPPAVNYGLTRMVQQSLVVLGLPMILCCVWLAKLIRIPTWCSEILLGLGIVVSYVILSGLLPTVTGGYKSSLSLSSRGFYYDAYYTHDEEVAAAAWLATAPPRGSHISSDEFMRRKLITYGGVFAQPSLVPATIPTDSYAVLSYGNTTTHSVPAYDTSNLIYYTTPDSFLADTKDIVYSSGHVTIYR